MRDSDVFLKEYASTLLDLSKEPSETFANGLLLQREAETLCAVFEKCGGLTDFLERPDLLLRQKLSVLGELLGGGTKTMRGFLYVALSNGRARHIHGILQEFLRLKRIEDGVISADIITQKPLSNPQREYIARFIAEKKGVPREKVSLRSIVDKNAVGGAAAVIDGVRVSLLVSDKIDEIRRECLY